MNRLSGAPTSTGAHTLLGGQLLVHEPPEGNWKAKQVRGVWTEGGRGSGEAGMKRVELKSKSNQEPARINLGTQQNGQWNSMCKCPVVGIFIEICDGWGERGSQGI